MSKSYSGIGSRQTVSKVLKLMEHIGFILAKRGYVLRSGGADGADSAFERGCDKGHGKKEIFLPWKGFNNNPSELYTVPDAAFEIAKKVHPAWDRLSNGGRLLQARNCNQVLGRNLDSPTSLVVCWHTGSGGTTQAVRLAKKYDIKVYNLYVDGEREEFRLFLKNL